MTNNESSYKNSVLKQFEYYKMLGERTILQLTEEQICWQPNEESNSIAMIIKHLHGNMMSRWTDFRTSDGEKTWRNRDEEFDNDLKSIKDIKAKWDEGWRCLFEAITPLADMDLEQIVYIRNMGHTITEAINRQLAHYSYHIGQIVYIGRLSKADQWISLSIPKGKSTAYNREKFSKGKRRTHFTDDL